MPVLDIFPPSVLSAVQRGLHTLARLMYGIPRRLTPIIETHRRAPLAAHYPTVVTLPCPRTLFLGVFLFALLALLALLYWRCEVATQM